MCFFFSAYPGLRNESVALLTGIGCSGILEVGAGFVLGTAGRSNLGIAKSGGW